MFSQSTWIKNLISGLQQPRNESLFHHERAKCLGQAVYLL